MLNKNIIRHYYDHYDIPHLKKTPLCETVLKLRQQTIGALPVILSFHSLDQNSPPQIYSDCSVRSQ